MIKQSDSSPALAAAAVVLPIGRVDNYLGQAVESVLTQVGVNLHVVLAFDGVAPPEANWLKHPWVSVLYSPHNRGISRTLNDAIAVAGTELVARMDADDICLPDRIATQVSYMTSHRSVAVLGGKAEIIDDVGRVIGMMPAARSDSLLRLTLPFRNTLVHPSVMLRRSVVDQVGGYRPEADGVEDHDLWLRVSRVAKLAVLDQVVLRYRRHAAQVTSGGTTPKQFDVLLQTRLEGRSKPRQAAILASHEMVMAARRRVGRVTPLDQTAKPSG